MKPLTISLIALGVWFAIPFVTLLIFTIGSALEKRK